MQKVQQLAQLFFLVLDILNLCVEKSDARVERLNKTRRQPIPESLQVAHAVIEVANDGIKADLFVHQSSINRLQISCCGTDASLINHQLHLRVHILLVDPVELVD